MNSINNKSFNAAALQKAKNKLKVLDLAFQNRYDTTFGKCIQCGNHIVYTAYNALNNL
ncbi:MAG: hypothetical protein L3J34_01580 [Flavobacteriaceae bacterium]|nr:hypothetical protein [Flavobacteriaceae bacterium]